MCWFMMTNCDECIVMSFDFASHLCEIFNQASMPTIVLIVHQSHEDSSHKRNLICVFRLEVIMYQVSSAASGSSPIMYLVTEESRHLPNSVGNHVALLQIIISWWSGSYWQRWWAWWCWCWWRWHWWCWWRRRPGSKSVRRLDWQLVRFLSEGETCSSLTNSKTILNKEAYKINHR